VSALNADLHHLAARVSSKIEEGDVRGAVRLAASNDTLASHDDDTLEALRQLHPARATPTTCHTDYRASAKVRQQNL